MQKFVQILCIMNYLGEYELKCSIIATISKSHDIYLVFIWHKKESTR